MYEPKLDRTSLMEGPAHIILPDGSTYLWCEGAVNVKLAEEFRDINVAGIGTVEALRSDGMVEVDFQPAGNMPAAVLAWLIGSLGTARVPCDRYGAVDQALTVHGIDGVKILLPNAAIHELPRLRMGAGLARWDGRVKAVGCLAKNTARTTAGSLYTRTAGQTFSAVPTVAEFARMPVQATWGANEIATQDGWSIAWTLRLSPRKDPNFGTITYRLTELICEARCRPLNLDETLWATAYVTGSSTAIGVGRTGADLELVEESPGLSCVLKNAHLVDVPMAFGEDEPRAGELTWRARRDISAGYGALFTLTHTA